MPWRVIRFSPTLRHLNPLLRLPFFSPTNSKMCFDDYDTYTSKTYIRNGQRYYEERTVPRTVSWRRRFGLGGAYYPSRYYSRPPAGRYIGGALSQHGRYGAYDAYPRGVVPGGYSRGVISGTHARPVIAGGYHQGFFPGTYSSGYAYGTGYHVGARSVMPANAAMVSFRSFLACPIALPSCLPLLHTASFTVIGSYLIPETWRTFVFGVATSWAWLPGRLLH